MHTYTVQYMNPYLVPGHTVLSRWGFFSFERDGVESEKEKEREIPSEDSVKGSCGEQISHVSKRKEGKHSSHSPRFLFLSLFVMGNKIYLKG